MLFGNARAADEILMSHLGEPAPIKCICGINRDSTNALFTYLRDE